MDNDTLHFVPVFPYPGLLPPQVSGRPSRRATIHPFLRIICEEISRATHLISGESAVREAYSYPINVTENLCR